MWSVAIPISVYYGKDKEISQWLIDNNASISDSIRHPYTTNNDPAIIVTFTDREVALMFKLMWA